MRTLQPNWPVTVLTVIVAVLATVLVMDFVRKDSGVALGQVSEGASANYTIALLGEMNGDQRPLFLIDTKAQTILFYEYFASQRLFLLRGARSYANDRALTEANMYDQSNIYKGPSVLDVQNYLRRGAAPMSTPPGLTR